MTKQPQKPQKRRPDYLVIIISIVIVVGAFFFIRNAMNPVYSISSIQLEDAVFNNEIKTMDVTPVGGDNIGWYQITGTFKDDSNIISKYDDRRRYSIIIVDPDASVINEYQSELSQNGATYTNTPRSGV